MQLSSIHPFARRGLAASAAVTLALGVTLAGPLAVPSYQAAHAAVVSVTVRERLATYGGWRTSSRFGEVWVPSVRPEWRPYTEGRWVWTDEGWYWESAEPFGGIVFHYGRWAYDPEFGWVWIAGYEWAPAWVVWRQGGDNIGWAPAPPRIADVAFDEGWWCFAPVAAIGVADVVSVVRPVRENVTIIRNTTIINQTVIVHNAPRVRLGNQVVAIDAGPRLPELPRAVVTSIKAAKIVPPRKGDFSEARLDPSKGEAVKMLAGNASLPAQGAAPVIAGTPEAAGHGPKKPAGVRTIRPAAAIAEGEPNAADRKHKRVIAGAGQVEIGETSDGKHAPRRRLNHQQMLAMRTPHHGPAKAEPHCPSLVQARKGAKCDPLVAHCKPPR
ncbi:MULTISPECIES: DUF6600 domain-containing protein [unclassified Mesorhizobium]|uniref:DUF6600 domain-containing protein n=1 Tax=unclassified Mesorhizobium TaxID=325217 RepID=UPI000FCB452F|nr:MULTISPECIES: DUF6600 domain-containing protein [unclassified Mesorhizobium]RUW75611.1 hypothetical protein EOA31_08675 [Mesorhizobium sp. M4B.F.Ca.ET.049.02.1.2]TGV27067.1 hypothetical protein EN786_09715 [Mesorhizobium sp. M4B.F.Ca.ET.143.01.1.1]